MIQRIQTLYLLATPILQPLTFFMPLATFGTTEGVSTLYAYELVDAAGVATTNPYYLWFLVILAMALPLGTIFRFKKRLTQIRWCVVEMVLIVGVVLMLGLYLYRFYTLFAEASPEVFICSFKVTLLCPLVALLSTWLAMRAIFRDEMLVRAADRIR